MVCLSDEGRVQATVKVVYRSGRTKQSTAIELFPTKPVNNIISEIANEFELEADGLELTIQTKDTTIRLNNFKDKLLNETGLILESDSQPQIEVSCKPGSKSKNAKNITLNVDDRFPFVSTSPTSAATETATTPLNETHPNIYQSIDYYPLPYRSSNHASDSRTLPDSELLDVCNYVGLVNQAMTCYLNSLLQALYMTPEFRNALYNWEFDGQNETRSIPFQLQKLFLNLQTSQKSAIETTDLTTSFGWQGSEAWQQHDVQELCRVMFDALEQKFKDTKQANLINDLYEGKMLDYVKCLECSTEKSREDTFLDIPLPVRPFGSDVAYNSVEEALRAFVQPETLDGNNQYYCEKCSKKCDAHKGLKFTKFPYLLTLHLKRFDFDYNTMHRIKLNDKVVFPESLNLNQFIPNLSNPEHDSNDERETAVKCDDCSTTDSGSALDDENCQVADVSSSMNGQDLNSQDEDEGIDMSIGTNHLENEKLTNQNLKGPYIYELFSIMIHSGSASGGHYYAYIKDFKSGSWFCFNDQNVTMITEDDIKKTYGGGPLRGHYSGAYSSSTNAYMLMYRQVDKERNCQAMTVENFPPYIRKLLKQMKEKEEQDRIIKEKEHDMVKLPVHCYNPVHGQLQTVKIMVFIDTELREVVKDAYQRFKLEGVVPLEDCRLVSYNKIQDCIDCSFEKDTLRLCDVSPKINSYCNEWMLEIRQPGQEFYTYKPGGINMKVYLVNYETEDVDGPMSIRINEGDTVFDFRNNFAKMYNVDINGMKLVQESYSSEPRYLNDEDAQIKYDLSISSNKMYVVNMPDEDPTKPFEFLYNVVERFTHLVSIDVVLPSNDLVALEALAIPPLDLNQNMDKLDMAGGDRATNNSPNLRVSPQHGISSVCAEGFGDQSNSEDSSLSDSDRTLVGDAPGDCLALLSSSSDSPADQHMASPSDPTEDTYNHEVFGNPTEDMNWDDQETPEPLQRCSHYYFKTTHIRNISSGDAYSETDYSRICRILVDKRMNLVKFKKCLEPLVGVPVEYFKIFRQYPNQDEEWSRYEKLSSLKDGERLIIKLGRVLKKDEFVGKIYHLRPDQNEVSTFLFEHVIAGGQTVGAVKKDIIFQAKKKHMLDISHSKSRLRKKNWKNPGKVYLDDQKFVSDIPISSNVEIFLQELDEVEKVTSTNQLVLFVRRWSPSTLTLGPPQEVILDVPTVDELKKKISVESAIPQEFVDIAYTKCAFPSDVNIMTIHYELNWNPNCTTLEEWPVQVYDDGSLFFYRDSREHQKELTPEERKEINQKENSRLGVFSRKTYSPGRERALKIYLDTSPNKSDDGCVD